MKLNYFNFKPIKNQILMTNDLGYYTFVSRDELKAIIGKKVDLQSPLGQNLLDKKMIFEETNLEYAQTHRYALREIKGHVNSATSLHIFVVTTACNMECIYCQANNGVEVPHMFMSREIAEKAVDIALESPNRNLSFEFQGGEPLLNFEIIQHIVDYTEIHKGEHKISYSIVSNLTLLTDEMIAFFLKYKISVSTSIDGPQLVHDHNRPFKKGTQINNQINNKTYEKVCDSIARLRAAGIYVGAIQTTTRYSLDYPAEIVHAYKDMGFDGIFIRPLTPLGKATRNWDAIGYTAEEFIEFYRKALAELLSINQSGHFMREDHATIFLRRMHGEGLNYMELRSPCGAGIGQMAYYSDGNIFTCDEGRMFYEMGNNAFRLGNVFENHYRDLIDNGVCRAVCASSLLETIPSCCDCVYQPYCGTCPVVNYAANEDLIEKQPRGYRCRIYGGIMDTLFECYQSNDPEVTGVLDSWCS